MTRPAITSPSVQKVLHEISLHEKITARDLAQRLRGLRPSSIGAAIRVLRDHDLVHRCGWKLDNTARMPVYALGQNPDAPYDRAEGTLAHERPTSFTPRPDPAAAWMLNPIVEDAA